MSSMEICSAALIDQVQRSILKVDNLGRTSMESADVLMLTLLLTRIFVVGHLGGPTNGLKKQMARLGASTELKQLQFPSLKFSVASFILRGRGSGVGQDTIQTRLSSCPTPVECMAAYGQSTSAATLLCRVSTPFWLKGRNKIPPHRVKGRSSQLCLNDQVSKQ